MTNVDRAIQVLEKARRHGEIHIHPHDAVEAIVQADLLATDPPEPSRGMTPRGAVWYLNAPIGDIRRTGEDIVAFGHDHRHQSFRLILTETEAKTIALALLAAANHAEEEACPR